MICCRPQEAQADRHRQIFSGYWPEDFCCNGLSTDAFDIAQIKLPPPHRREQMAKMNGLDKMSYAELSQLRVQVDRLLVEKQNAERVALRQKLSDMAKEHGLSLEEVLGKGRKGKGSVAPKFRETYITNTTW